MPDDRSQAQHWRLRVLGDDDAGMLQRFFDANPEYFLAVNGEPPRPDEATHELHDAPPPEMAYREMRLLGFFSAGTGELEAMATVVVDLIAEHVGHIGLFIVATALHGSGAAHAMYAELERWLRERGAHWIRLGVVAGNARAERFWERSGYVETRRRGPVEMGRRTHLLRVMVKPLAGAVAEYLDLVARDRPDAP
jgi:ribosomal protein S18 acetylase RimI-like enzyme